MPAPNLNILHIKAPCDDLALLDWLVTTTGQSLEMLKELFWLGAIYLNESRLTTGNPPLLRTGDYIRLHLRPRRFALPPHPFRDLVVGCDEDFVIAVKPAGFPTHATLDNARENLLVGLESEFGVLRAANRLDQMTLGLVVFARSAETLRCFQRWQKQGLVQKEYAAYTDRPLPLGNHIHFMPKSHWPKREVKTFGGPTDARCELEILEILEVFAPHYRVQPVFCHRLRLKTGRTHQIRAQANALGAPLLGDALYGSPHPVFPPSALRSTRLSFPDKHGNMRDFSLSSQFETT